MSQIHVRHSRELRFTIVATPHQYRVEYAVYDIEGWGDADKPLWHRAGSDTWPDIVETIEESELYLHGEVKWDGCSNWHFDAQESVMLHGCSRGDLLRHGEIMAMCWDWTAELCPSWDT